MELDGEANYLFLKPTDLDRDDVAIIVKSD
jgi:hypothetical protein